MKRRLAVSLHAVGPDTLERCALIRDWLADNGVERMTLVVTPPSGVLPFEGDLADWLAERQTAGDAVVARPPSGEQHRTSLGALRGRRGRLAAGGEVLRVDVHPADLAGGRGVAALERLLRRVHDRAAVTCEEL